VLDAVLDLGVVTLASGKLRVVYAMAEPAAGWVEAVRRASGVGVTPVVLVPKGHAGEARGMLEVEIDVPEQLGARNVARVLGRIAEALESDVEPFRLYDDEVVIEPATERLWVTGVLVPLSDKLWRYVEYLARAGKAVTTKEIGLLPVALGIPGRLGSKGTNRRRTADTSGARSRRRRRRRGRPAHRHRGPARRALRVGVRVLGSKSSTHRTEVLSG
jgi:hypothetical protein